MKYFALISFFHVSITFTYCQSTYDKLLVVSYDGFRFDYLDKFRELTPVLNSLKSHSSYAKCLLNVFPTQTFPNHFSIATGLYAGVHGVLGSRVYDKDSDKLLKYSYELFHYNENVTPIWTLNEKAGNGRHSGVMMWPGSDFEYQNISSTFIYKFDEGVSYDTRISTVMSWFNHPITPANFVMLYFEEPDGMSHAFGPGSPQMKEQIKRVDTLTKNILDSLKSNRLDNVNVIFLSDHGMEAVTRGQIIDLRPFVGNISDMYGTSPVLQVYPKEGVSVINVYNKLKEASVKISHFKVYLQADIPAHFHIKHCRRAPPILAVADPPYAFQDLYSGIDWYVKHKNASSNGTYGVHGYDPNDVNMHPYFIAHGPLFKENYNAGEIRTIDLFPLFSNVLKLSPPQLVRPNGTIENVEKLFKWQKSSSSSKTAIGKGTGLPLKMAPFFPGVIPGITFGPAISNWFEKIIRKYK